MLIVEHSIIYLQFSLIKFSFSLLFDESDWLNFNDYYYLLFNVSVAYCQLEYKFKSWFSILSRFILKSFLKFFTFVAQEDLKTEPYLKASLYSMFINPVMKA
ncbi:hypothetical protein CDIK_1716 [Cucumispora dikerogammari]|nr:hypothetical protein CDIK_1716 [Cucumispora dikerogammari]